jgi:hypothetical protein
LFLVISPDGKLGNIVTVFSGDRESSALFNHSFRVAGLRAFFL